MNEASQNPHKPKKPGMMAHACNTGDEEVEKGSLAIQPNLIRES